MLVFVLLGLVLLLLLCYTHLALLVASVLCCFPAALLHCLHRGIGVPHAAAAGQQCSSTAASSAMYQAGKPE